MKRRANRHHMDGLIALLLFGVFAACVLAVLLTGANAYQRLVRRDQAAYERRTCAQYIAARVRQADRDGEVQVCGFEGVQALVLGQGNEYVTRLYFLDGWLMELYAAADAGLAPGDGAPVLEIEGLELSLEDGLLTAEIGVPGGMRDTLRLSLRSGEGAGR